MLRSALDSAEARVSSSWDAKNTSLCEEDIPNGFIMFDGW